MRFKTRLTLAFGLFAFLLCILFALLLDESLTTVEDQIVASLLAQEADFLTDRYRQDPGRLVLPDLEQLRGFVSGQPNLPTWLQSLEPGLHENRNYILLIRDLDAEKRLYLLYDESSGVLDRHESSLKLILAMLVLIVSVVGIALGFYQARLLARPVENLVTQVEGVDTDNPEITPLASKDEIGVLSRAYADLLDRLGQYIQREKAFTRYASHELMTPVAIINNNLELLQNENASAAIQARAIDRLQDAVTHMQRQIEIFLMLAREGQLEPTLQPLDWDALWNDTIGHFPQVSVTMQVAAEPRIHANLAAVQVMLVNIMSNVVKHGAHEDGIFNAVLTLDDHSLTVSNRIARSAPEDAAGYGFGLEINEKLCEAIGWRFGTRREGDVFIVSMDFEAD